MTQHWSADRLNQEHFGLNHAILDDNRNILKQLTAKEAAKGRNRDVVDYAAGLLGSLVRAGSVQVVAAQMSNWGDLNDKEKVASAEIIHGFLNLGNAYPGITNETFPNGVTPSAIDAAQEKQLKPNDLALRASQNLLKETFLALNDIGIAPKDIARLKLSAIPEVSNDDYSYTKKDFLAQIGIDLEGPQRKIEVSF